MHVLLLSQFFHPDVSAVAQLATELAEDLVEQGVRVTAVASRGTYLGGTRLAGRAVYRGIRIVRVESTWFGKGNVIARMGDYASFLASAFGWISLSERPDVVLALSTPPLIAAVAMAAQAARRTPFVYWVQDVYPDLAVEFGVLSRTSRVTKALEAVSGLILRRADAVIALGEAMAERLVQKGARRDCLHVVPNWADPDALRPVLHAENPFRSEHGLESKRVVLYSGNMGRCHDIETLLAAAESLRHRDDIVFLFVGDGVKRPLIMEASRRHAGIRLLPYQPRESLSQSLSAGDVHVVTQSANTLGLVEPSKVYAAMAVGRPVLYIGPVASEVARTVRSHGIGEIVANDDARAATDAIGRLLLRPGASAGFLDGDQRRSRTSEIGKILRRSSLRSAGSSGQRRESFGNPS